MSATATAALTKMRAAAAKAKKAPAVDPTGLPWDRIKVVEAVFQRRGPVLNYSREAFIDELARDTKRRGSAQHLEPVVVWWAGAWFLVDGHHRMAAIRKGLGTAAVVPVTVLQGDLEAALAASIGLNRKTKLSMARSERLSAAWFLTVNAPGMSRAQVVEATGVSDGTVSEQRRVLKALKQRWEAADFDAGRNDDPAGMTWKQAQAAADGKHRPPWDAAAGKRAAVEAITRTLTATLGRQIATNPEAVMEALREVNPAFFDNENTEDDDHPLGGSANPAAPQADPWAAVRAALSEAG